jgi:uncharacterized glyoxalase superfamily protein PhnB
VDFHIRAFGATVLYRSPSPQVSTEEPAQRRDKVEGELLASPETLGGSTCVFQVAVENVDEAYKRAVECGAAPALPPIDMFWGDRYGWVRDPFGHVWALTTVNEVLTPQEVAERLSGFAARMRSQNE